MTDNEREFLQSLQAGDKVHLCSRHKEGSPPLHAATVIEASEESVMLQEIVGLRKGGTVAWDIRDLIGSFRIEPYTEEAEFARRKRKEQVAISFKLSDISPKQWASLPTDALDDICAILRENGVNV